MYIYMYTVFLHVCVCCNSKQQKLSAIFVSGSIYENGSILLEAFFASLFFPFPLSLVFIALFKK